MTGFFSSAWLRRAACLVICSGGVAATSGAWAQQVLFSGPAGQVSGVDVRADAATRVSDAARSTVLSRAANVQQLASNLYVQRAMAVEAQRKGLASGPEAEAQLVLAREKALADLYWADFDKRHQPADAALESYAKSTYRAADTKALEAPERARVRHILIKLATPDAQVRIAELLAKAKDGASFTQLARENSEDQGSAARGGDVGFMAKGDAAPAFEQAMDALKTPGELSGVVETPHGYHIIRLEERREAGTRQFDEVRDQLLMQARSALLKEARTKEVQRLQEGATPNEAAIGGFVSQFKPVEVR